MRARTLSRIMVAKAIAALALSASAGGVALAATSTSLPDQPEAAESQESDLVAGATDHAADPTSAEPAPAPDPDDANARPAGPAEPDANGLIGLCQAWSAGATANNGNAAESPAFTALRQAARGENIDSYCATIRTEHPTSVRPTTPAGERGPNTNAGENADPSDNTAQPGERPASPPRQGQDKPEQANNSADDAHPSGRRNTAPDRPSQPDNAPDQPNTAADQH